MSSKGSKSMAKRRIKSGVSTEQRTIYHNMMPPQDLFDKHGRYLPQYAENGIRTAKYNPLSFVPKNLFEQFRRLANFYFLGLIVIQCFPMFNIRPVYFAALPIVTIVIITAIKDGVEDLRRHTSDREINYSMGLVLDSDVKNSNYLGTSLTFIQQVYRELLEKLMALMKLPYRRDVSSSSVAQLSPVPSYVPPPSPTKLQSESKKKASWKQTLWKDIRVGDIIYLTNNETIPADIIVLSTSEPDCICYVETKNLDGETNLKLRNGYTQLSLIKDAADVDKLRFYAECEPPSSNLYTFNGALSYQLCSEDTAFSEPMKKLPITCNELLLRGCVLRNTKWVIGVVAFCGKETKLMMNSGDTPSKRSLIERQMNKQVLSNFALLVILCMIMGIMGTIAQAERAGKGYIYLPESNTSPGSDDYQSPSYFGMTVFWIGMILLQNLVPISLYITAEFMKTLQAYFIYCDLDMYHEPLDTTCVPRTWTIADDLGQIEYVFSDKTGTLTRNVMEFKRCSINGVCYGGVGFGNSGGDSGESFEQMRAALTKHYDNPYLIGSPTFTDPHFVADLNDTASQRSKNIRDFFMNLALCHTVLCEYPDDDNWTKLDYKAQSPDEAALVGTARDMGFTFTGREKDMITVDVLGTELSYEFLHVIEFTSTRKRMSVLLRRPKDNKVILYCKGADSVIYERSAKGQDKLKESTSAHLDLFANQGLRTLVLAYKELSEEEYKQWADEYMAASSSLENREAKMDAVASQVEKDLILLGATAIEDRLQEGVPECIARLAKAGIKLWVLTGDKTETAINIGFSCRLLTKEMMLIVIKASDFDSTRSQIASVMKKCFDLSPDGVPAHLVKEEEVNFYEDSMNRPNNRGTLDFKNSEFALIIDGTSLKFALDKRISPSFLNLATRCKAVVCCRVSPLQKAQVVSLVKNSRNVMSLAIGDGANDVSMIQEAHIGVGIQGQEGMQAVMSSDYAVAQFRYLTKLLLVHGRWAYFRTAEMFLLMFYKNFIWGLVLFWYQIYCGWSAQILYDYFFVLFYNLVSTSLPPLILGVFDQDIIPEFALNAPQLYKSGIRQELYSYKLFLLYCLDGVYQSLTCYYISMYAFGDVTTSAFGYSSDISQFGTVAAIMAVVSANTYMGLCFHRWTWITHFVVWGSSFVFMLIIIVYSYFPQSSLSGVVEHLFSQASFWFTVIIGVFVALLPRFVLKYFLLQTRPRDVDIIKEIEKYRLAGEWNRIKWKNSDGEQDGSFPVQSSDKNKENFTTKTKRQIDKLYSDTVKSIKPVFRKATRLLFAKDGNYEANTGYAFSQEPGIGVHLSNLDDHGPLKRTEKKDLPHQTDLVEERALELGDEVTSTSHE